MFINKLLVTLVFTFVFSISPFYKLFRIQSEKQIRNSEDLNFAGEKSLTQWWYFDCVLEDGSVMVFLFAPYEWWSEGEDMPTNKSLIYFSYLENGGKVTSEKLVFDATELTFGDDYISSPYFTLEKGHGKDRKNYTLNLSMNGVSGSVKIHSVSKAFSPLPGGAMGRLASKYILNLKGDEPEFRYASHIPEGKAVCNLKINSRDISLSAKVYHEQGMFSGHPYQMGNGWAWFHFVSDSYNIFGTPEEFFCMQKNGKKLIGGITLFNNGCVLSDVVYDSAIPNLIRGGKLEFSSSNLSFNIKAKGKIEESSVLISIPSKNTAQVWGTCAQPSVIQVYENGVLKEETGWLLLETCKMGIESSSPNL